MAEKAMTVPASSAATDAERSPSVDKNIICQNSWDCNQNSEFSGNLCLNAATVPLMNVERLWRPYIPYGKVTIIDGDPGVGKSRFALDIAARVTSGVAFPFSNQERLPANVIYQTTEDDYPDTVIPRFIAAGGNPSRFFYIDEETLGRITFTDKRLVHAVKAYKARLLVLDPLSAYIGGVSLNAANEVRPQFNALITLAKETGCAIVVISHLNKSQNHKLIQRTVGSIDIAGAARSKITIDADPENLSRKFLLHTKSNLTRAGNCILILQ